MAVVPPPAARVLRWKRGLDLVLAVPALVLLAPVLGIIALIVRLDSPGPALFRQERIGLGGKPFEILKFRSMRWQAGDDLHRRSASAWFQGMPTPDGYKDPKDNRITRVGGLLRRTSLDELPQLLNVVRGEMSLVGPRPGIAYELEHYEPWYYERQAVVPGITGLWQASGRDKRSAREMMELDIEYVRSVSLGLDLKILALTVPALFGLRNRVPIGIHDA